MITTVLGSDLATGEPVGLSADERRQGLYIIGKTGTGKSTLLEHLIVQDIEAGLGVCVLDPHGDLVDAVLRRIPRSREPSVVLLDLADDQFPFGLNLFECRDLGDRKLVGRVATQAVEVFEKLWGAVSWGPQLAQILRNCAYTLVENPGFTMTEMRRLLTDQAFRMKLVRQLSNPQVIEFWEREYDLLRPQDQQQIIRSTLNKVDEFLTPAVYPIVGFGRTTVDFRQAMDTRKIVLVRLALGEVGSQAVGLIGSIVVGQISNAALSRQDVAPHARFQFNLYADEYQRFATPTFAELLAEARKYAVATTLAHQFRDQLEDAANRGSTLNAGNLVVFAVHGRDAEELAKQFDRTPPPPEITGQRPVLSIVRDPVSHLVLAGHESARVRELAAGALNRWVTLARSMNSDEVAQADGSIDTHGFGIMRGSLERGLDVLNHYLLSLMEGTVLLDSEEEALRLVDTVVALRGIIGLEANEWQSKEDLFADRSSDPRDGKELLFPRVTRYEFGATELLRAFILSYVTGGDSAEQQRSRLALSDAVRGHFGTAGDGVAELSRHLHWIRELGQLLVQQPIYRDSGQWEPIYDRPRSYSDVEGEIASSLVGLPKYTARYRLGAGPTVKEGVMRTPEHRAIEANEESRVRTERIKERTRMEYCAPVKAVLAEIAARHRSDDDPPGVIRRVPI